MSFAPRSPADVGALIDAHPLAWVVSRDYDATLLPLLAERDGDGRLVSLLGHYARRNPQVAVLVRDGGALVLFNGPAGYVSPMLVSKSDWGPTWNYAAVRLEVDVAFVPDETDAAIRRLGAHLEGADGWTVERMGARYPLLAAQVIAFRAIIRTCEPVFKLGQDETSESFGEIVVRHPDRALARYMADQRG